MLPDLDLRTADTLGCAQIKERSSEHKAFELSACTELSTQCAEHRHGADWTDGSLQVRGLLFLLTALALPVSEGTHTNSPACPTPPCCMTDALTVEGARIKPAAVTSRVSRV